MPEPLRYIPALDGLRAVAVGLVLALHLSLPGFRGGQLGVDIFFVLSGFLITRLLLAEREERGGIALVGFYARRALRLYPALLVLLLVTLGTGLATARQAIIAVTYMSDIAMVFGGQNLGSLGHTWTLAVEEHFYLLWPLLLPFLWGRRTVYLVGGTALMLIYGTLVLALAPERTQTFPEYFRPDVRVGELLLGCLLAILFARGWQAPTWAATAGVLGLAGGFLLAGQIQHTYYAVGTLLCTIGSAAIIAGLTQRPDQGLARVLSSPAIRHIGQVSYAIYLWHLPVILWVTKHVHQRYALQVALAVALTLGAAEFSRLFVERPALGLKRRWSASRAQAQELTLRRAPISTTHSPN